MLLALLLVALVVGQDDRPSPTLEQLSKENLVPCDDNTKPDVLTTLSKLYMHKGDVEMALKCAELGVSPIPLTPCLRSGLTAVVAAPVRQRRVAQGPHGSCQRLVSAGST